MTIMTSRNISPRLCEALGLPKHTLWFELRADASSDKAVTIKCMYFPEEADGNLADAILTEYELVERKP